jgi:hypothetical protein
MLKTSGGRLDFLVCFKARYGNHIPGRFVFNYQMMAVKFLLLSLKLCSPDPFNFSIASIMVPRESYSCHFLVNAQHLMVVNSLIVRLVPNCADS